MQLKKPFNFQIIGGATTYLVILVQFQAMTEV